MQPTKLRGARTNNLRSIDLDIAPGTYLAIVGPSGAGKSSLAFQTLYAEGQRRYVESFSAYARQFLERLSRPPVDELDPLPVGIAVDRQAPVRTSRSTVGTMTEIADYAKHLWSHAAELHCPRCGQLVHRDAPTRAAQSVLSELAGQKVRWGADLVGGNVARHDHVVLDLALLGEVEPQDLLLRSGGRPGDVLLVTGDLGASAAGLALRRAPRGATRHLPERHAQTVRARLHVPEPRLDVGRILGRLGATAALETYWKDDEFPAEVWRKGELLGGLLREIKQRRPECMQAVRGRGLIWGLEMTSPALAKAVARGAFERRVVIELAGPRDEVVCGDILKEGLFIREIALFEQETPRALDVHHDILVLFYFDVHLLDVRDATAEEISHGLVHGPGGHHH